MATLPGKVWLALTVGMGLDDSMQQWLQPTSSQFRGMPGATHGRFAVGHIYENPQHFTAGCCPTEETAKKVWTLMKMEFPRAALKAGLESTREASCGAMITEQTRCEWQHHDEDAQGLRGCHHARQSIRFPNEAPPGAQRVLEEGADAPGPAAEVPEEEPEQAGRAAGVGGRLDQHCFQEALPRQIAEGSSAP